MTNVAKRVGAADEMLARWAGREMPWLVQAALKQRQSNQPISPMGYGVHKRLTERIERGPLKRDDRLRRGSCQPLTATFSFQSSNHITLPSQVMAFSSLRAWLPTSASAAFDTLASFPAGMSAGWSQTARGPGAGRAGLGLLDELRDDSNDEDGNELQRVNEALRRLCWQAGRDDE